MKLDPNRYKLSDSLNECIYQEISADYIKGETIQNQDKKAIYLAAQPGSGKTALGNFVIVKENLKPGIDTVILNTDDLRPYHPDYDRLESDPKTNVLAPSLVNADCSIWFQKLVRDAVSLNYNLLFDTTLGAKDLSRFTNSMKRLKDESGYHLQLEVLAIKQELSRMGIYLRYESKLAKSGSGRFVGMEVHDLNYNMLIPNIEAVLKNIPFKKASAYKRLISEVNGEIKNNSVTELISLSEPSGKKIDLLTSEIVKERNRPLSNLENRYFQGRYNQVISFIQKRGADLNAFIADIQGVNQPNLVKLDFSAGGNLKIKL